MKIKRHRFEVSVGSVLAGDPLAGLLRHLVRFGERLGFGVNANEGFGAGGAHQHPGVVVENEF